MSGERSPLQGHELAGAAPPTPAGWIGRRMPSLIILSVGMVGVISLALAAEGGWLVFRGQAAEGFLLAAGAVYLGHVVGLGVWMGWPRRRSRDKGLFLTERDGVKAVTFRYSGWAYYWVCTLMAMSEVVCVLLVLGAASAGGGAVVFAVLLAAVALVVLWALVTMLCLAPGELTLSAVRVFHRSLASTFVVPWDAIAYVNAEWLGTPVITVGVLLSPDTRLRRYLGRFGSGEVQVVPTPLPIPARRMVVRTMWLRTDGAVAYHALRFYLAHPELRAELATANSLAGITGNIQDP